MTKVAETLFEKRVLVVAEVSEELADDSFLFVIEVTDVVELMDVTEIGKHFFGWCHVLVDVVKVGNQ